MRLIDADTYKEKLIREINKSGKYTTYECGLDDAVNFLESQPTVNIVKERFGSIVETIKNGKMNRVFSCCNTDYTQLTSWTTPNYCPNCGAKID